MAEGSSSSSATVSASKVPVDVQNYLERDYISIPNQRFALVSCVGPEQPQKCDQFAIKIRGVFGSKEEADTYVRRLMQYDNKFHVYVVEMGAWLVLPPNHDLIEDQQYQEGFLQDIMKGYAESQLGAQQLFEERKQAVMRDGIDKHLLPHERLPPPPEMQEANDEE
jgi:hypothetical protein